MNKKWLSRKWVISGLVGVLVLGGGYWGYTQLKAEPAAATNITAPAKMGNVKKVITATGTVNFPHSIPLQFSNKGQVVELNVKDGDSVKKGQVLARIDEADLQTTVQQQQANLKTAQTKLQSIRDGFNAQTKATAQSALIKAEQNLITAQQNADPAYLANQVSLADQNVKQASDALAKAQQSGVASSIQAAQSSLSQALETQTAAQNLQNGGAELALSAAQADLTAAQYKMNQEEAGPTAADLQAAEASITQAQAQLDSAKTKLAEATILAPTDAVVINCGLQLYQYTTDASTITITPTEGTGSNLEVAATIDQADIAQVKIGQKVDITLDAYPDEHSSGTVSLVALQGTTTQNVTTFKVTVAIDKASDKLRSGMNANVNIVVAEAGNVLTVPSEAIITVGSNKVVLVPIITADSTGQEGQGGQADQADQRKVRQPDQAAPAGAGAKETASSGRSVGNATTRPITVEVGLDDGINVELKVV
ncbi:MAG: biotin/lipoyl-binding protein [Desulfitobacteriaceae bacterium]|nr:biotin/lipoyl-binding protein [Desulfitobacteriaceae bacterium]MDD4345940.1 biotin/lipoyl-binding protein [Desulfitobacteriaceae bacterium]MDD4401376.1 biotin/lipoyl-binding protein [Desulfitobacteriaceae bacterium]